MQRTKKEEPCNFTRPHPELNFSSLACEDLTEEAKEWEYLDYVRNPKNYI